MKHDLPRRLAIAIPIAAYYAVSSMYDGLYRLPYLVALIAFGLVALNDFYRIATHSEYERPFRLTGFAFAVFIIALFWNERFKTLPYFSEVSLSIRQFSLAITLNSEAPMRLLMLALLTCAALQFTRGNSRGAIYSVSATVIGLIYAVIPICYTALMFNLPDGIFYAWLVSWATFLGDTSAYLAGKLWGKHKAGIFVSPHKTIEGYLGGAVLNIPFTCAFYYTAGMFWQVPGLSLVELTSWSILIYLLTIAGDLIESLLKRDSGKKDAGEYLPGHGGLLDIVDSFLLTMPISYYYLAWRLQY